VDERPRRPRRHTTGASETHLEGDDLGRRVQARDRRVVPLLVRRQQRRHFLPNGPRAALHGMHHIINISTTMKTTWTTQHDHHHVAATITHLLREAEHGIGAPAALRLVPQHVLHDLGDVGRGHAFAQPAALHVGRRHRPHLATHADVFERIVRVNQ